MMKGMGNMQGMMKQMQKMQKEMTEAQGQLNETSFIGKASQELVTATFTGDKKMTDISIKAEAIDPDDTEMLGDLVLMAVNDALKQIDEETQRTLGQYTKGMPGF